ncbi:hypothetical protein [Terrimonas pollutisoli]|uniref:hypothetical protein n=1 Tax=Terrimonas pollutisoli TaxID=3034147 RepID=UPI0023ED4993|nr:hypothetical protein [Terrimonas sp. H1YJ31]
MQPQEAFEKEKTGTPKIVSFQQERSISRGAIIRIIIGILLLLVLAHIGFYKTYIRHFPGFADYTTPAGRKFHFTWIIHFHGMMMIGWLLMLLLQPFLILKGKIKLHRLAGRLSYVIAPLVLLSMYLVTYSSLHRELAQGIAVAASRIALDVPLIIFFAILYLLAIFYTHKPALHSRFMCSTAFILISPALSRTLRAYLDASREDSIDMSKNIIVIVAGVIAVVDSWRTKRISPFALVLGFMVLNRIIWNIRDTPFWYSIANAIAKMF